MKKYIQELVSVDSMGKEAPLQYTVIELEKEGGNKGKVIYSICNDVSVGDIFSTTPETDPLWHKEGTDHSFKLVNFKDYLATCMKENTPGGYHFIHRIVNARQQFTSVIGNTHT